MLFFDDFSASSSLICVSSSSICWQSRDDGWRRFCKWILALFYFPLARPCQLIPKSVKRQECHMARFRTSRSNCPTCLKTNYRSVNIAIQITLISNFRRFHRGTTREAALVEVSRPRNVRVSQRPEGSFKNRSPERFSLPVKTFKFTIGMRLLQVTRILNIHWRLNNWTNGRWRSISMSQNCLIVKWKTTGFSTNDEFIIRLSRPRYPISSKCLPIHWLVFMGGPMDVNTPKLLIGLWYRE